MRSSAGHTSVVERSSCRLGSVNRLELRSTTLVWPALLRKVDRLDPNYKN